MVMPVTDPALTQLTAELAVNPDGTLVCNVVDRLQELDLWTWDTVRDLVFAHPEPDGFRLLAAEWWERAEPVLMKCPRCKGKGYYSYNGAEFGYTVDDCEDCNKTGTILDPTPQQRAELCRVQCEIAALQRQGHGEGCTRVADYLKSRKHGAGGQMVPICTDCTEMLYKQDRESALLTIARQQWESVSCEACRGTGDSQQTEVVGRGRLVTAKECPVCGGTGDLLACSRCACPGSLTPCLCNGTGRRPVTWERGFPVVSATSGDVWQDEFRGRLVVEVGMRGPAKMVPTPWAVAVCRDFVMGLRLTDKTPHEYRGDFFYYDGCRQMSSVPDGALPNYLPSQIFAEMAKAGVWFDYAKGLSSLKSRDAAELALAWAVAKWVRGNAG